MARAISVTHEHPLTLVNTQPKTLAADNRVRILDAGCGSGRLIAYLHENLAKLNPSVSFEVFGFDVANQGVQAGGYFAKTVDFLSERFPCCPWSERLALVFAAERWPFPDGYFHVIISNQVVEHVENHDFFFSEAHRTLCDGCFSVHLFPLAHCVLEGHLRLPWVHKIKTHETRVSYIRFLSRLGFGKYKLLRDRCTIDGYSQSHADYVQCLTNYVS